MSRVFISGSSDGLGLMAARLLVDGGHEVTLHARNTARAEDARRTVPQAKAVAVGDLSSIEETRRVAEQVNALGRHDAVIHNAGVGYREARRVETVSCWQRRPQIAFAVCWSDAAWSSSRCDIARFL
jgi:NAD(P)-dependent dehydrogenase (short-subunit alcohol dehydrogenase family)